MRNSVFFKTDSRILFPLLLTANSLLSYSHWPLWAKSCVFLAGILLPLVVFSSRPVFENKKMAAYGESFSVPKDKWIWAGLIGLALYLRFFKLTDFHAWPTGDESLHGFLAIDLVRNPRWQFFYTVGEHPPLLIWGVAFLFKFFKSPGFNLWFLPAVFSALTVPVGYLAVRSFFSKSLSVIYTGLLSFTFWPLYFGRFCHQSVFIPFWEMTCLLLLSRALQTREPKRRNSRLLIFGFWTGLGSLTFTAWLVVMVILTAVVFRLFFKKSLKPFFVYSLGLFAGFLPFLVSAFKYGYGGHLLDASEASHWFSLDHQILTSVSYVTSVFWGSLQSGASYGPVWGGMLNPLLSTVFFIGLLEMYFHRRDGFARWLTVSILVGFLPGLLTADYVEFNRVLQVMPALLFVTALGFQRLLLEWKGRPWRWGLVLLLTLGSFSLDLNHLLMPVFDFSFSHFRFKRGVLDENAKAFGILKETEDHMGPGLIFTDFLLLSHNHSLSVMTYPFNAALNPKLDPARAAWAGVVANVHYGPYLAKRFPRSRWVWLDRNTAQDDGGMAVGIIPINDDNRDTFRKWNQAHEIFHGLSVQAENILNNKTEYQRAESELPVYSSLMSRDPFLECCFDEWSAQYHYGKSYEKNIEAIQRAIQKGYPAAHLFYKLGGFYWLNGQYREAKDAYEEAANQRPNFTAASQAAKNMEEWILASHPASGVK